MELAVKDAMKDVLLLLLSISSSVIIIIIIVIIILSSSSSSSSITTTITISIVITILKDSFRPEFLNRIDDNIIFRPLGRKARVVIIVIVMIVVSMVIRIVIVIIIIIIMIIVIVVIIIILIVRARSRWIGRRSEARRFAGCEFRTGARRRGRAGRTGGELAKTLRIVSSTSK